MQWSYWSPRQQSCRVGRPGEICDGGGNPGTMIVGYGGDYSGIPQSLEGFFAAGILVIGFYTWLASHSGYYVAYVAQPWLSDGLRIGDIITHVGNAPVTDEELELVDGGTITVSRNGQSVSVSLSPVPE